ncbi:MAG: thioredoxin family protein [Desulfobulbaceae bacterium]|nr:thioredoxin family protein [Desulfobulbaceae bacterium]
MKNRYAVLILSLVFIRLFAAGEIFAASGTPQDIPVKDTVTMVDLGAKSCIPCKMMAPILEELKGEYQGRAAVIFIDVREDPSQGRRFGISSIPTQIFYNKDGLEEYRHIGFLSKEKIKETLDELIKIK